MAIPSRHTMAGGAQAYEVKIEKSSDFHGHFYFLLTLMTEGEGIQTLNGRQIKFSPGYMFFLSPADFHKNTVIGDGFKYFGVKIPYELLEGELSELSFFHTLPFGVRLSEKDYQAATEIFKRLVEECNSKEERVGGGVYIRCMVRELVIIVLRNAELCKVAKPSDFVNRALGYIYSHFSEELSVTDAAAYMGYTENYFNYKFKSLFDLPFAEYLRNVRLEYAEALVLSGTTSITEIAMESGFGSSEHFSRAFAKKYGMPPREYRKLCKKEK